MSTKKVTKVTKPKYYHVHVSKEAYGKLKKLAAAKKIPMKHFVDQLLAK